MENLLVGAVGFLQDLADLLFDLSSGAGGLGNVLDQVTCILQERLDLGNVGEIIFASFAGRWDGQIARFLDEQAGTPDALGGENKTGHGNSLISFQAGGGKNA